MIISIAFLILRSMIIVRIILRSMIKLSCEYYDAKYFYDYSFHAHEAPNTTLFTLVINILLILQA
jgi:hypothetical protein